jgi:hypothetical protein
VVVVAQVDKLVVVTIIPVTHYICQDVVMEDSLAAVRVVVAIEAGVVEAL